MKIKEIVKVAEVSPDTVRFYNRERLLRPRQDPQNGYYVYGSEDLCGLRFVRVANKLGLSLDEIKVLLSQTMDESFASGDLKELFADRLARLEQELNELKRLRDDMKAAIEVWQQMPDGTPNGHSVQELIERWS
jgi:MerR family transcriptional regulator, Zn(II)-responsive regulator of zntA